MNQAFAFLRRAAQTHATIRDEASQEEQRIQSVRVAYRVMAVVQMLAQMLLWVIHWLYADISRATWQAVALQLLPALATWAVWRSVPFRTPRLQSLRVRLLLLPCSLVDCCLLLCTLSLFCQLQLPSWPSHTLALVLYALVFFTVTLGGKHGIPFGINQIRTLLLVLLLGVVLLDVEPKVDHLWPFFGKGPGAMLQSALAGIGSLWGVALLFALPRDATPPRLSSKRSPTLGWVLIPWLLLALWALWLCLGGTWQSNNPLLPKEKMIILAWRGSDLLLFQFSTVFWLLLLTMSLAGNTASALFLLDEAIPRFPKRIATAIYLVPPLIFTLFPEESTLPFLLLLLPYRFVLAFGTGALTLFLERRRPA